MIELWSHEQQKHFVFKEVGISIEAICADCLGWNSAGVCFPLTHTAVVGCFLNSIPSQLLWRAFRILVQVVDAPLWPCRISLVADVPGSLTSEEEVISTVHGGEFLEIPRSECVDSEQVIQLNKCAVGFHAVLSVRQMWKGRLYLLNL